MSAAFFVDGAVGDGKGLGLYCSLAHDLDAWRHGSPCKPGLWRLVVTPSVPALRALGWSTDWGRDAVVDDFGTLQVVTS